MAKKSDSKILKECSYKSYDWADSPVILDSLFREYDLRNPIQTMMKGGKPVAAGINAEGFKVLGQAYGTFIQKKLKVKKAVVGHDYRSYSSGLAYAFITGLMSSGIDVIDIGTQLSPVIYFAQYHFKSKAAAMVTASHNDNGWTGLKLAKGFSQTFEPAEIEEFKKLVYSNKFVKGKGSYEKVYGFKELYLKDITRMIRPFIGKKKLKIVASGSNGLGGLFLVEMLKSLGFTVIPYINDLDWDFPKYNPNPEHVKLLDDIGEKVRQEKADMGIITDGDGDRLGIVDENGKKIFADRIGLYLARYFVEDTGKPGAKIIIDVKSTNAFALDHILKRFKAETIFCKTGHSYVKAATHKYGAIAGFEKSGHFFLKGKYGRGYDDASVSAAWVAVVASNSQLSVSKMIDDQPKSYQSPTLEPSVKDDKEKYVIVDKVIKFFKDLKEKNQRFAGLEIEKLITINGIRVVFKGGAWGLVRASSNQPNLVITCESFKSRREMYDIIEAIQAHLKNYNLGEYDQQMPPYPGEDK